MENVAERLSIMANCLLSFQQLEKKWLNCTGAWFFSRNDQVPILGNMQPTVGIIDSQSVKTTSVVGELRGYDAGKETKQNNLKISKQPLKKFMELVTKYR